MWKALLSTERTIWTWLVTSSADPTRAALTVKGALVLVLPQVMQFLPLVGIHLSPDFASAPDTIYSVVFYGLSILGSAMTFVGVVRKLYRLLIPVYPPNPLG